MSDMSPADPENPEGESSEPNEDVGLPNLPKIVKFETLTRCGDEVWIEHNGQIYRLRKTRQEKLILTK